MSELQFEGQREGEKLTLVFRRHFLTMRTGMVWLLSCIALGTALLLLWQDSSVVFWIFMVMLLIGVLGFGYVYVLWYFSVYLVTDQRMRQIIQKGIFKKTVVDLTWEKVDNISYHVPGIFGGIFHYGTILLQTGVGDLVISMVPNPEKVYNQMQDAMRKA